MELILVHIVFGVNIGENGQSVSVTLVSIDEMGFVFAASIERLEGIEVRGVVMSVDLGQLALLVSEDALVAIIAVGFTIKVTTIVLLEVGI